MHSDTYENLA